MVRVCEICEFNSQAELLNVPKDEKKRKTWSEACKMTLKSTALICVKHFKPSDFVGARLKRNAIPCLNINLSTDVKVEPEIVTSNEALHDPLVKIEVENIEAQLENLIHEEIFDKINKSSENNTLFSKADVEANDKHLTCGCIVVELENESFKLKCKYCENAFEITEYQTFVKHIKEVHANCLRSARNTHPDETERTETLNLDNAAIQRVIATDEQCIKKELEIEETHFDTDNDFEQSDNSFEADEDYPPKTKKAKQSMDDHKSTKDQKNAELNKIRAKKGEDNMVTFDTMPQKYVITFLELIKSNAILWHRRQSILKRFDEALAAILTTFNKTYPKHQLTDECARLSINRIKDLYQRVTDPNHKRPIKSSTYKTKFPAFFEHCRAIEENSKKVIYACDKCLAFFFTEIDLQIHKVKRHRIGELPFKCSRCNYGFTKAEKLDEHEAKHNRSRDFVCENCNRGFNNEEKLRAHAITHSDDAKPVCEKCGQMFSTYNKYRRHKLRHEAPKEKCNICGKFFFEKWNLSEHIKSHLNERGYNCDVCGKSFNHQNDVTIHKRGVHNMKPQKRRPRWVNKNEVTAHESDNESRSKNKNEESSDESPNVYSDNYHNFRPSF